MYTHVCIYTHIYIYIYIYIFVCIMPLNQGPLKISTRGRAGQRRHGPGRACRTRPRYHYYTIYIHTYIRTYIRTYVRTYIHTYILI